MQEGEVIMKYKPCCSRRCCVAGCPINEQGGCYCACRIMDGIKMAKSVIEGHSVGKGCIYYSQLEDAKNHVARLTPEKRAEEDHFREVTAPEILKNLEEKLKSYEIDDG